MIYIEQKKTILGGTPVITGTRIPVSRLLYLLQQGYSIHDIQTDYPQLTHKTITGVIGVIAEKAEQGIFFTPEK